MKICHADEDENKLFPFLIHTPHHAICDVDIFRALNKKYSQQSSGNCYAAANFLIFLFTFFHEIEFS